VPTLLLPFHQDELLGDRSIVIPEGRPHSVVSPRLPQAAQWERLASLYEIVADEVAASLAAGKHATVVTGDCLAALATLAGTQRAGRDPSLVWFDAHGDVHTLASSTSGYLGGMALRMAVGGDPDLLATPLGIRPLPESRAVLVDARDLDPAEVDYVSTAPIRRTTVDAVDADALPDGPVMVHIDLDVIEAGEIPGLRFPATGGPTSEMVLAALERLLTTGRVTVLDVACPWLDPTDEAQVTSRADLLARVLSLRPEG
jgi:arginase family enzyme